MFETMSSTVKAHRMDLIDCHNAAIKLGKTLDKLLLMSTMGRSALMYLALTFRMIHKEHTGTKGFNSTLLLKSSKGWALDIEFDVHNIAWLPPSGPQLLVESRGEY